MFIIFLKKRLMSKKIAIFASGKGTNTEKICSFFSSSHDTEVSLLCSNKKSSGIFRLAKKNNLNSYFLEKPTQNSFYLLSLFLKKEKIDYIVLAGFLLKVPLFIIKDYPNKIINIHPSLLPKFGGKGMYGKNVHKAVIKNKEKTSGVTVHYVNENYDDGAIIYQHVYSLKKNETYATLAMEIQKIEHHHYPLIIEGVIKKEL